MSDLADRISKLSPGRLALLALDLHAQVDRLKRDRTEPIAIVGMSCRFPGHAVDPGAFWDVLRGGRDEISEIPPDRWDVDAFYDSDPEAAGKMYARSGGFLRSIDQFDPQFFGMAPREAVSLDPQQRLLLEVSWEALESAGQAPDALHGTRTGVFVGISSGDYARLHMLSGRPVDAHYGTGNAPSIAAGRLSYFFGLQGPCAAIDTACSSSLVAVHMACQSLRNGEAQLALAGGVNVILAAETNVFLSRAGMLAPDGRCKTFDAAADGYVRSEGCGVVVLKRLGDAVAAGDRVLAVIRGSAMNQDGRSSGLTAPNGPAQEALVRDALARAGIESDDVDYVEAHGTGTSLGDPIEVQALGAVFGAGRASGAPLLIGSVKTNIGHLEAAAGMAGLIKMVLALQHEELPAHLHFHAPNPNVAWDALPLSVVSERRPWPRTARRRIAGVSSFGFSGTNAHVIVEEPPLVEERAAGVDRPRHLLALSAKTETALRELAGRYAPHLAGERSSLADVCFSANTGRARFEYRLAIGGATLDEVTRQLDAAAADTRPLRAAIGRAISTPEVAFVLDDSSDWCELWRALHGSQPAFRAAIDQCAAILTVDLPAPLIEMLDAAAASHANPEPAHADLMRFAVQYALAEMWRSWGVRPVAVSGNGIGEYVAGCLAGVFALEDGLALAAAHGRGQAELDRVSAGIVYRQPSIDVITGATGDLATAADLVTPAYWRRPRQQWTQVERATAALARAGSGVVLHVAACRVDSTISPCPAASVADQLCLERAVDARDGWTRVLDAAGALYVQGARIDWTGFDRGYARRKVALPTYPFQRQRYWIEAPLSQSPIAVAPAAVPQATMAAYEIVWERLAEAVAKQSLTPGVVVIFADRRGVSARVGRLLEARGFTVRLVFPSGASGASSVEALQADPRESEGFRRVLDQVTIDDGACSCVLYLWSFDDEDDPASPPSIAAQRTSLSLAHLTRALVDGGADSRLIIATRGAQAVAAGEPTVAVRQSAAWGMGRVIALEHPDLAARLIDVEAGSLDDEARMLVDELLQGDDEDQVAVRTAGRYAARLTAVDAPASAAAALSADATYLITGGLGALGLRIARWLAARGARHLALVGRRGLPDRDAWDALPREGSEWAQVSAVRELEAQGIDIGIVRADVADAGAMREAIDALRAGAHPLRGVVHAAGVSTARAVVDLDAAAIDEVLQSKVAGAWNLHALTADLDLDFFIMFSSIASVWGSHSLGHYAAANHFLDALAHHRKALKRPALSINWGPWAGGGMATAEAQDVLASIGVRALDPDDAIRMLDGLVAGGRTQVTVASVDWTLFKALYSARGRRPLLDRIALPAVAASAPGSEGAAERVARLRATPTDGRADMLMEWVGDDVMAVLGSGRVPERDQRFFDIGMDSIMTVDLRRRLERRLGCALAPTVAFDYPTIARLSAHLAEQLSLDDRQAAGIASPIAANGLPGSAASVAALTELSDDEVERMFAARVLDRGAGR